METLCQEIDDLKKNNKIVTKFFLEGRFNFDTDFSILPLMNRGFVWHEDPQILDNLQ